MDLDQIIFNLINKGWASQPLDAPMLAITLLGMSEIMLIASVLLFLKKDKKAALTLFAGLVIENIIVFLLKNWLAVPRPSGDIRLLASESSFSFPSGHAANAFLGAKVLGYYCKVWRVPLYLLALLIGISRVYIGAHWPSDVFAGSIIGYGIGYIATHKIAQGKIRKFL